MSKEVETGVELPDSGLIDTAWAKEQLERVNIWSQELMNYGKGQVFNMLKISLSPNGYEQSVKELGYTVPTAETYINYLQLRPVLEAIKDKYFLALSLSASEYLPDDIEEALALCDIAIAKRYGLTAEGFKKALEDSGKSTTKMSDAAITVEANKKKSLMDWLADEHNMSEDDVAEAQRSHQEGRIEFNDKMIEAFDRLDDWDEFYNIIAPTVIASDNSKAIRFLSDITDASDSIFEYLAAERASMALETLKSTFENTVYPKLQFDEHHKEQ